MKQNGTDFQQLKNLHQKGELDKAKKGYLRLLKKNPDHVDTLHSLGILYAQENNFSEAQKYLELAHRLAPTNQAIVLHLANVFKFQQSFQTAAALLENAIKLNPLFVPAYNNLGTVYYAQENYTGALNAYQQAISHEPQFVDAYYNLGLTYLKIQNYLKAEETFTQLIKLAPEHLAAQFHLGCSLQAQSKIEEAIQVFLLIEEKKPDHFETQTNLGTAYLKLGKLTEAKTHYLKALENQPNDLQILFNLGVINTQQGFIDAAIRYYQKALIHHPNEFNLHNNLGVAFITKQHIPFALKHFQEALRLQPNNKAIQHTLDFLSQNKSITSSPPNYVKTLFDAYADHYDVHLRSALDYKIPSLFLKIMKAHVNEISLSILDLGCGTGLLGESFKPLANRLIGVDLSPNMLQMAQTKALYEQLIEDDILHFLTVNTDHFDLILAGDVLVYFGELEILFEKISRHLTKNGFFLFNSEMSQEDSFYMTQSGRFAHHKNYIEKMGPRFNLKTIHYETAVTRYQNNEPVYGHVFLLQKIC